MILAIYGAGGQGRVLMRLAHEINIFKKYWDEILFVDDVIPDQQVMGRRVYRFAQISEIFNVDDIEFAISLGEPMHRQMLFEKVEKSGYEFSESIIADELDLEYDCFGKGTVISKNVYIPNNIAIAENVYISNGASIGHDTVIGKHTFVCAAAAIGGGCSIGEGSFIGLNATIKDHLKIGSSAIVGIGSCVFMDLPDGAKAVGNPARIVPNPEGQRVYY